MERQESKVDAPVSSAKEESGNSLFNAAYNFAEATAVMGSKAMTAVDSAAGSALDTAAKFLSNFSLISEAKADTLIDTGGGTYIDANDGSFIPNTIDQGGGYYYVPSTGRTIHRDN